MIKRTYKYRLYPTKTQQEILEKTLCSCCWLYNHFLEQRRNAYEKDKTRITCFDQIKQIPKLKKEKPELNQIYSQVLQDVPRRLDKAFQNFFRRVVENKNGKNQKPGYPRFKGKNRYDSLVYPQSGFALQDNKLTLSKIGSITIILHREIKGSIKTLTIRRTNTNKWYACFSIEIIKELPQKPLLENIPRKDCVGIDAGLTSFLTTDTGKEIENPRYLRASEEKLARVQRNHSRKKLRSKNREKSRLHVAQIHEKTTNQRIDFLHKLTNSLIKNYIFIGYENLLIRNMVKNKYLSKSIYDAAWGTLFNLLNYKAEEAGKWAVGVNPKKTTITCSQCKKIVFKSLSTRTHTCPHCKLVLSRDENAARNILALALSTAGTAGINACGVERILSTMKQEALSL
ncbi:transposase [Patescibacteria group bacterium AH-259-L07]|nr:transposase [Patescibacteria group bacterium AH-259-L07]